MLWELLLLQPSVGSVLSEDVFSHVSVPVRDVSRLDGYAVRSSDVPGKLLVVGSSPAGGGGPGVVERGTCVYVGTGGVLPRGADAVIGVEESRGIFDDESGREEQVDLRVSVVPGAGIRPAGSDIQVGDLLASGGSVVDAGLCATLAAARVARVRVTRIPVVGVLSTGDEVASGEIGDANRPALLASLQSLGVRTVDLGTIGDDYDQLYTAIRRALAQCDAIVTTGGVSMGAKDYIQRILESLASTSSRPHSSSSSSSTSSSSMPPTRTVSGGPGVPGIRFGRVCMKPGKPTTFAVLPPSCIDSSPPSSGPSLSPTSPAYSASSADVLPPRGQPRLFFALPGNPASALVSFALFVAPGLRRLMGVPIPLCPPPRLQAVTLSPLRQDHQRPEYHRAIAWVQPIGASGERDELAAAATIAYDDTTTTSSSSSSPHPSSSSSSSSYSSSSSPSRPTIFALSTGVQVSSRAASTAGANVLLCIPPGESTIDAGTTLPALSIGPLLPAPPDEEHATAATSGASLPPPSSHHHHHHHSHSHHHPHSHTHSRHHSHTHPSSPFSKRPDSGYESGSDRSTPSGSSARGESGFGGVGGGGDGGRDHHSHSHPHSHSRSHHHHHHDHHHGHDDRSDGSREDLVSVRASVIVASDRCARGEASDRSGALAADMLGKIPGISLTHPVSIEIVPDDSDAIAEAVERACAVAGLSLPPALVVLSGGTGFGPRDVTPEAVAPLLERQAPGIVHTLLRSGIEHTPLAALSRPVAGTRGRALVFTLPGSTKAVSEGLEALTPILPHAMQLIAQPQSE